MNRPCWWPASADTQLDKRLLGAVIRACVYTINEDRNVTRWLSHGLPDQLLPLPRYSHLRTSRGKFVLGQDVARDRTWQDLFTAATWVDHAHTISAHIPSSHQHSYGWRYRWYGQQRSPCTQERRITMALARSIRVLAASVAVGTAGYGTWRVLVRKASSA